MSFKYILTLGIAFILSGCLSSTAPSNKAISADSLRDKSDMQLLELEDTFEEEEVDENNKELYFLDTKGEILYVSASGNIGIEYKVKQLLNTVFQKTKMPRKPRGKKVQVSLEVSKKLKNKNEILTLSQNYILKKKKLALANTDKESLHALKKVLKREKDTLYKKRYKIKSRQASDIILYISGDSKKLHAKIIAKNGTILGYASVSMQTKKQQGQWVEVSVPRNDGAAQLFDVMLKPVSQKEYYGSGADKPVTNISFVMANNFCKERMHAQLLHPYVFEYARRSLAIHKSTSGANIEIMAPYDEEDHEEYYQDGDDLEAPDGTIATFDWNSERYFATSNLFKSPNSTFRCMRDK